MKIILKMEKEETKTDSGPFSTLEENIHSLQRWTLELLGLDLCKAEILHIFGDSSPERLLLFWGYCGLLEKHLKLSRSIHGWLETNSSEAIKFRVLHIEGLKVGPNVVGICGEVFAEEWVREQASLSIPCALVYQVDLSIA